MTFIRTLDDAGGASKEAVQFMPKNNHGTRGAFGKSKNRPPSPILDSQSPPPKTPIKFEELQDSIELPPSVKGDICQSRSLASVSAKLEQYCRLNEPGPVAWGAPLSGTLS